MAINFPTAPTNGQLHTESGITWVYVSAKSVWQISVAGSLIAHTHPQSDIINLVADLAAKAALSHTHTAANISDSTAAGRAMLLAANAAAQRALLANPEYMLLAVSDEITVLTTGVAKLSFRMPYAFTLTSVKASLNVASTVGIVTIDIKEAGVTIFSTLLTIDINELTSVTAAVAAVISDAALAADALITIDVTIAGTGAKGLKVTLIGRQ